MSGKQVHRGKERRAEELLDARQRETAWKLFHSGYAPELLAERYGMTLAEFEDLIRRIGAERKRAAETSTDWHAKYASSMASHV
ncbi:hypothetical protein [Neoaquamicrobium sediminum]|uniref:Uncharacterized protein n=1 Tax=Neoaquamicrobium sediminum TaxID=1849104 RepID=A0ABV3WTQ4_9HYPH